MIKFAYRCALLCLFPLVAQAAQPWQEVTVPTTAEAAASFANPPSEYRAIHWAIWGGQQTKEKIISDIDKAHAAGAGMYMINNSRGVQPPYLSPEYMDLVKTVVAQCKKNGMKVWIETDCGYPDGFAGGAITKKYPQLGMKGIAIDARCTVADGATLEMALPIDTLGIIARPAAAVGAAAAAGEPLPMPADGVLKYAAPRGRPGQVVLQLPTTEMRYTVMPGEPFAIPVPTGTKAIRVEAAAGGGGGARGGRGAAADSPAATIVAVPADGNLKWTAPAGGGAYELSFVRHIFKTSPTRNDNGEDGGAAKDTFYTVIDYLDPEACAAFTKEVHEVYEKAVGEEFGKTVLGFRGDETDYTGVMPWTPKLLETFQKQKGYDLKPHIASFFVTPLSTDAMRAKADYWDVWSGMFRDVFYKQQQEWCRARGMDYMSHLNHEEIMVGRNGGESMTSNEGSFFRDMRYVGVPGVDNLNQIGPGIVADFPKLAASASHLFGRALAWTESGGSLGAPGKFVFDYSLVRGINYMNVRGMTGQAGGGGGRARAGAAGAGAPGGARGAASAPAAAAAPAAPPVPVDMSVGTGFYYSRAQHMMAIGRPAAQVALYSPTDSYWLNDAEADASTVKLTTQLMEHQIDFDHIDHDSLASICTLEKDGLKNESGQVYRGVVIPSITVIQKSMLERLRAFAAGGGKVVFVGRTPTVVVGQSFLHPEAGAPDLSFATFEPSGDITAKVEAALPKPDVKLDAACPPIKYMHRSLKDGEVYFFFNESTEAQTRTATLAGTGDVQIWDAASGTIKAMAGAGKAVGSVSVPLALAAHESRFVVIGPMGK